MSPGGIFKTIFAICISLVYMTVNIVHYDIMMLKLLLSDPALARTSSRSIFSNMAGLINWVRRLASSAATY